MSKIDEAREEFSKDLYATKLSGIMIDEIGEPGGRLLLPRQNFLKMVRETASTKLM